MRIVIGGDHAGFAIKGDLREFIKGLGHDVADIGCHSAEPVDFPDIAQMLCARIITGQAERGLMVCGTGVGASIVANKIAGIRAAVCHDVHSAHQSVEHDDVNVMCLGCQIVGLWLARDLVSAFLQATFERSPDFVRRTAKISSLEAGRDRL